MTFALQSLIADACIVLASPACLDGRHDWQSEGGRACPQDYDCNCSQAVYRCRTCGDYDYGEPGGPGATDCATDCLGRRLGLTPGEEDDASRQSD